MLGSDTQWITKVAEEGKENLSFSTLLDAK